jgi:hypothetical protein
MIKQLLLQLLNEQFKIQPILCRVDSVTDMTCNVTPINGAAPVHNVKLIANDEADKYFVFVPKVNSHVIIIFITNATAFVAMVDEIEKVICKVDDVIMEVDTAGFLLKRKNETLLQIMEDLITAITNETHAHPQGPTTGVINVAEFQAIKTRFTTLLKGN